MPQMVQFELVSPERLLFAEEVEMVVVPGTEGDFGVLPEHAPMISTIRPGVIDIYRRGVVVDRIFIAGGFAEVTEIGCMILAEEAILVDSLDRTMVDRRLTEAQRALQEADTPAARTRAESRIAVAEAMQEALKLAQ